MHCHTDSNTARTSHITGRLPKYLSYFSCNFNQSLCYNFQWTRNSSLITCLHISQLKEVLQHTYLLIESHIHLCCCLPSFAQYRTAGYYNEAIAVSAFRLWGGLLCRFVCLFLLVGWVRFIFCLSVFYSLDLSHASLPYRLQS